MYESTTTTTTTTTTINHTIYRSTGINDEECRNNFTLHSNIIYNFNNMSHYGWMPAMSATTLGCHYLYHAHYYFFFFCCRCCCCCCCCRHRQEVKIIIRRTKLHWPRAARSWKRRANFLFFLSDRKQEDYCRTSLASDKVTYSGNKNRVEEQEDYRLLNDMLPRTMHYVVVCDNYYQVLIITMLSRGCQPRPVVVVLI